MQRIFSTSLTSFQRVISLKRPPCCLHSALHHKESGILLLAGHHEHFKELIMAPWSPSPKAPNPGIKLFVFKCQSSRQHSSTETSSLESELDTGLKTDLPGYTPWPVGGGNLIGAFLLVLAQVFTDVICSASGRTENPGELEFHAPSRVRGANPAKPFGISELERPAVWPEFKGSSALIWTLQSKSIYPCRL